MIQVRPFWQALHQKLIWRTPCYVSKGCDLFIGDGICACTRTEDIKRTALSQDRGVTNEQKVRELPAGMGRILAQGDKILYHRRALWSHFCFRDGTRLRCKLATSCKNPRPRPCWTPHFVRVTTESPSSPPKVNLTHPLPCEQGVRSFLGDGICACTRAEGFLIFQSRKWAHMSAPKKGRKEVYRCYFNFAVPSLL